MRLAETIAVSGSKHPTRREFLGGLSTAAALSLMQACRGSAKQEEGSPTDQASKPQAKTQVTGSGATIRWSKAICKEPDNYPAWPSIARTAEGDLLVVFSGDREEHVCPYGKTEMIRSQDRGVTWSMPEIINSTPLDDRDAGLIVLQSGTLVVSWFTVKTWEKLDYYRGMKRWANHQIDGWERHCRKLSEETRQRWLGNWTRRSSDGGQTWEPAVDSIASAPHGPIQLQDSRLLYVGTAELEGSPAIVCCASDDEARSWRQIGRLPVSEEDLEKYGFTEPHIAEVAKDEIYCILRTHHLSIGYNYASRSLDGGRTWSNPEATPLYGYDQPGHLLILNDGRLLCTYGRRAEPFGCRACVSGDGGRTWPMDQEIILRDDAPNTDMGYPATAEIEPRELLTVYYQIDQPGEKVSIHATRWSLAT